MSSKIIFTQTHAPQTNRFIDGFDSAVYSNLAIGKIQGQCRTLPALMSTLATDEDVWRIVNLQSKKDGMNVYDAIAVLGAASDEQAKDWALQQFGQFYDAVATDVHQSSPQGLIRHIANRQYHAYQSPVRASDLATMQDMVTGQQVQWDGIELKSHSGQAGIVLVDMIKHDDHHQLLDAMDRDGLTELLASFGAEFANYDALIVEKHNLDRLMSRLSTAMAKASEVGVSVTKVTQTEPFKKNKVTQIAVLFEMNDGQSVAIVFHNPDTTPSKLLPQDTLISWKWMLNGRDVSAAIQPNQGEDVQLPILATRIMKLVNQNSARFKRQQAAKAKTQQGLDDARKRLGEQSEVIVALDAEMAEIQKQIDEVVVLNVAPEAENNEEVAKKVLADETGQTVYATLTKDDPKVWVLKSSNYFAPGSGIFKSFGAETHGDELIQRFETKNDADKWAIENGYKLASEDDGASVNPISNEDAERLVADLSAQLDAIDVELNKRRDLVAQFYQLNYTPSSQHPSGWENEGLQQQYYVLVRAAQELDGKKRDVALELTTLNAQLQQAKDAVNPAKALSDKTKRREREVTSSTYERAQKRLLGDYENWRGGSQSTKKIGLNANEDDGLEKPVAGSFDLNEANSNQAAIDFLSRIIDGSIDAATVDMDYIIALAEKYQDDETVNVVVEQALEVINQAEQAAAQSVA